MQVEKGVRIVANWAKAIERGQMQASLLAQLKVILTENKMLPTSENAWVSLTDGVYVIDDADLAQHFRGLPNVHFLWSSPGGPRYANLTTGVLSIFCTGSS